MKTTLKLLSCFLFAALFCSCKDDLQKPKAEVSTKALPAYDYYPRSYVRPDMENYSRAETDELLYYALRNIAGNDVLSRIQAADVTPIYSYPIINVLDQVFQYAECEWYMKEYNEFRELYNYPPILFYVYNFPNNGGYAIVNADPRRKAFVLSSSLSGEFDPEYFYGFGRAVNDYPSPEEGIIRLGRDIGGRASSPNKVLGLDFYQFDAITRGLWKKAMTPKMSLSTIANMCCVFVMRNREITLTTPGGGGGGSVSYTSIVNPLISWSNEVLRSKKEYYRTMKNCALGFDNSMSLAKLLVYTMCPCEYVEVFEVLQSNPQDESGQDLVNSFSGQFISCNAPAEYYVNKFRKGCMDIVQLADPDDCFNGRIYEDEPNCDMSRHGIPMIIQMGDSAVYPLVGIRTVEYPNREDNMLYIDMHRENDQKSKGDCLDEDEKRSHLELVHFGLLFPNATPRSDADGEYDNKIYRILIER